MAAKAKELILNAAENLFRSAGYNGTGTNAIIANAGVSKGSFFYHFPDKWSLLDAVLERYFERYLERPLELLDHKHEAPRKTLESYVDQLERWAIEAEYSGGCLLGNISLELVDAEPRAQAKVAELFARWRAQIHSIISRRPPAWELDGFVTLFLSALQGVTMITRAHKDKDIARNDWQSCRQLIQAAYPKTDGDFSK